MDDTTNKESSEHMESSIKLYLISAQVLPIAKITKSFSTDLILISIVFIIWVLLI